MWCTPALGGSSHLCQQRHPGLYPSGCIMFIMCVGDGGRGSLFLTPTRTQEGSGATWITQAIIHLGVCLSPKRQVWRGRLQSNSILASPGPCWLGDAKERGNRRVLRWEVGQGRGAEVVGVCLQARGDSDRRCERNGLHITVGGCSPCRAHRVL